MIHSTSALSFLSIFALSAGLSIGAAPAQAQASFVGEVGACMLETGGGEPVNIGACKLLPAECTPTACALTFEWNEGFTTEITGGSAQEVRSGTAMNGQTAYAPVALVQSDPRDCIYNEVTDGVFCWVPGVEAQASAINSPAGRAMLMEIAGAQPTASVEEEGGKKKSRSDSGAALTAAFQGKYRPLPSWSCGEIGTHGGATAIEGDRLLSLETECRLTEGQPIGANGTVMFKALCSGEGETWEDEYILRRDDWGSLALLRNDAVSIWQACE